MKAIAKHDCFVTKTLSLSATDLNRIEVKKGEVIDFPIYGDEELSKMYADVLGERQVVFQNGGILLPTYSKDFDYID
jgi:hypothetical protein